jgi:hypothetical protein
MKLLRILAVTSFLAGVALLAYGFVQSGDDDNAASPEPVQTYDIRVTLTPTPATSSTAEPPHPYSLRRRRNPAAPPSLDVDSAIEVIGVKSNNEMDVPTTRSIPAGTTSKAGANRARHQLRLRRTRRLFEHSRSVQ